MPKAQKLAPISSIPTITRTFIVLRQPICMPEGSMMLYIDEQSYYYHQTGHSIHLEDAAKVSSFLLISSNEYRRRDLESLSYPPLARVKIKCSFKPRRMPKLKGVHWRPDDLRVYALDRQEESVPQSLEPVPLLFTQYHTLRLRTGKGNDDKSSKVVCPDYRITIPLTAKEYVYLRKNLTCDIVFGFSFEIDETA